MKMGEEEENIISGPELEDPLPECSLAQVIFMGLKNQPEDKVLQIEAETGKEAKSGEFLMMSIRAGEGLKAIGVEQGDRVALAGKNGIDIYAAAVGTLFIGAAPAPVDPGMKSFEFQHIFKLIEPKVVLCDAEVAEEISSALIEIENSAPVIIIGADPDESTTNKTYEEILKDPEDLEEFRPPFVEDNSQSVCFVVCSSGTTGLPKAVLLPDKCLLFQFKMWQQHGKDMHLDNMTFLHTSHFFWISGILMFGACSAMGITRVIIRNFEAPIILQAIQDYRPAWCIIAPSLLWTLLSYSEFTNYDVSSMKVVLAGGSPLPKGTVAKFREIWSEHAFCNQAYGCSEMGGVATHNTGEISSIGTPFPGVELKVVGPEGNALGPDESGEIYIRTPCTMLGYINNEEATRSALDENGWIHSGDIGHYNDQGAFYITGRIKEFIKYKNMQIAPAEIEELILSIPGVADVGVAGVAVDSDTYYPMALVVKEGESEVTEEDIVKVVNENLSDYKQLRGGICFVENVPRTPTGKVKRVELQKLAKTLYLEDL